MTGYNAREQPSKPMPIERTTAAVDGENHEAEDDADRLACLILTDITVKASILVMLPKPQIIDFRQNVLAFLGYDSKQFENFHEAFLGAQTELQ